MIKKSANLLLLIIVVLFPAFVYSGEIQQGDSIIIVTPGVRARLCPYPDCGLGAHITRIPEGTTLVVRAISIVKFKLWNVPWYQVNFAGVTGWLSIYNTNKAPNYRQPDLKPQTGYLYIDTDPENSKIRILNIRSKFYQGIFLLPGKYHIEVSAKGYITRKKWIIMPVGGSQREFFRLKKDLNAELAEARRRLDEEKRKLVNEKAWLQAERRRLDEEKRLFEKERKQFEENIKFEFEKLDVMKDNLEKVSLPPSSAQKTITGLYKYTNGIIFDPKTNLEWYVGPDKDTTWEEAKVWLKTLTVGGRDWRMPKRSELKALYHKDVGKRNMDRAFETTG